MGDNNNNNNTNNVIVSPEKQKEMEDYLSTNGLNEILKTLVAELFTTKPERPVQFMQKVLDRYRKIEDQLIVQQQQQSNTNNNSIVQESTEKEEEDMVIDDQNVSILLNRKRRGAVSSEPATEVESVPMDIPLLPKGEATNARLDKALSTNVLCSHLDENERKEVFNAMYEVRYSAGAEIITQGDPDGDKFYVVDEGQCDVYVKTGEEVKHVQCVKAGGSFGELALIYNTPRAATVKATTDVKLWSINRIMYRRVLMDSTIRKRRMYEAFLDKVPILAPLQKYERLTVADALEPANFDENEVIVRQGEPGDVFYIIIEGKAKVTQTTESGVEKLVSELGPSDYFGEIALLTDRVRAATVIAGETLKCVRLDRDRFNRVLGPCEDILRRNMEAYNKYMAHQL